ncbi:MAG: hypothetical protein KDH15_09505 [Rhodocyclaceae bacterium]|nr:hypothetical protein [Rhodocyclaceae bacterium]
MAISLPEDDTQYLIHEIIPADIADDIVMEVSPRQNAQLRLRAKIIIAKATPGAETYVYISLENTEISPGPMQVNKVNAKGFFQDLVTVTMTITRAKKGEKPAPADEFLLLADAPGTQNGTGTTTSSVSFSVNGAASAGFFGPAPMATVQEGAGFTQSCSFSANHPNFATANDSTGRSAIHRYLMETAHQGMAYKEPEDLIDHTKPANPDIFSNLLHPDKWGVSTVMDPPKLACSNLELVSQAVWRSRNGHPIATDAHIELKIEQRLQKVVSNTKGLDAFDVSSTVTHSATIRLNLPFARLAADVPTVL